MRSGTAFKDIGRLHRTITRRLLMSRATLSTFDEDIHARGCDRTFLF